MATVRIKATEIDEEGARSARPAATLQSKPNRVIGAPAGAAESGREQLATGT